MNIRIYGVGFWALLAGVIISACVADIFYNLITIFITITFVVMLGLWGGLYVWHLQYKNWQVQRTCRKKSLLPFSFRVKRVIKGIKMEKTELPQRSKAGYATVYALAIIWCGIWFVIDVGIFQGYGLLVWIFCTSIFLPVTIYRIGKRIKKQGYKSWSLAWRDGLNDFARKSSKSDWRWASKVGSPIRRGGMSFGNISADNFRNIVQEKKDREFQKWLDDHS